MDDQQRARYDSIFTRMDKLRDQAKWTTYTAPERPFLALTEALGVAVGASTFAQLSGDSDAAAAFGAAYDQLTGQWLTEFRFQVDYRIRARERELEGKRKQQLARAELLRRPWWRRWFSSAPAPRAQPASSGSDA